MNRNTYIILIVIIILIILGIVMYRANDTDDMMHDSESAMTSDTNDQSVDTSGPAVSATTTTTTTTVNVDTNSTVKAFTVTGSNFAFAPKQLTVKKGDTVKITFVNSGGTHDFKIDEFNVETKKINGGQQDVVTFVANKAGTFEYYCSVGTHRQMGMVGKLIVQ